MNQSFNLSAMDMFNEKALDEEYQTLRHWLIDFRHCLEIHENEKIEK